MNSPFALIAAAMVIATAFSPVGPVAQATDDVPAIALVDVFAASDDRGSVEKGRD